VSKPPKILIAVVTCGADKFRARANAQRATWVKDVGTRADVRYFMAFQAGKVPEQDEVYLDCDDAYPALPYKVRKMLQWALANGYTLVFKTDDDCYVKPDNLLRDLPRGHYVGHLNDTPPVWISGLGYWLSHRAMKIGAFAEIPKDEWAEDRWMGGVMRAAGIRPVDDPEIYPAGVTPCRHAIRPTTKVTCEFPPDEMLKAHEGPRSWRERAASAEVKRMKQTQREMELQSRRDREEQRARVAAGRVPRRGDGSPLA
jgi:hypothetical protein